MRTSTAVDLEGAPAGVGAFARDLLQLAKPRITGLVIFTFGGGLLLAPGKLATKIAWERGLIALFGTTLVVAAANAINMYLERDIDGRMRRTQRRPLPQGRLAPFVALALGAMLACASIPMLLVGGGPIVTLLGLVAFYTYVWAYTPLKRRTPASLYVGAVPGAMPPLMGWVAVTGRIDLGGLALFALMFVWQIPHFTAIAVFRADDYEGAGFRVISLRRSPRSTRAIVVLSSLALLPVTWALVKLGVAGWLYGAAALGLGLVFVGMSARVYALPPDGPRTIRWAKGFFFYSLIYLTAIFGALALDRVI